MRQDDNARGPRDPYRALLASRKTQGAAALVVLQLDLGTGESRLVPETPDVAAERRKEDAIGVLQQFTNSCAWTRRHGCLFQAKAP